MKSLIMLLVLFSFSNILQAADIPSVEVGAQNYNQQMCIENYTSSCINEVCLNSEDINCQEKCQAGAVDKCSQQSGTDINNELDNDEISN